LNKKEKDLGLIFSFLRGIVRTKSLNFKILKFLLLIFIVLHKKVIVLILKLIF